MYQLTERRFQKVEHILEDYRNQLILNGCFYAPSFEGEMRSSLNLGYQTLKDIVRDIVKKHSRYRLVALYYMQFMNAPGPVSEFQKYLDAEYSSLGLSRLKEEDRKLFWEKQIDQLRKSSDSYDDGFSDFVEETES
ncbi:hypothetical protein DTL42_19470 [Bremerella cremea]|uniref:Uncharacterized protein n=2 Tax=Bremerella cremea TaxID=1031537 RepID=A0A368KM91_9BACT|nr:hypothetical protein DTL42_19470 [Bremerella cremea]